MNPIRVGLLGLGTVGRGTFEILRRNQEEIRRRAGRGIEIVKIAVRDASRARTVDGGVVEVTDSPEQLVRSAGIDIDVELIGGPCPGAGGNRQPQARRDGQQGAAGGARQ